MNLSFTEEFYPHLEDLSPEQIAEAREKVVASLQPALPDVDLTPGTPTGDFVVTPLSIFRAGAEEANNRFLSDLNLDNVSDGLIYSCDFVRAFLGNFAVYDVEHLRATGLVRLTFTSPGARTVPRTMRFRFGTADVWRIRAVDPGTAELTLLAAGSEHNGEPDTYTLAQTSANTWAVDIPLEGVMTAPVLAGTAGTATEVPSDLVGVAAPVQFMSGLPSASLPELARMARKLAFSLTAGSRSSTRALVYRNWPESNMVSPIVPGDVEMQRIAPGSSLALLRPAVDLYFRSARDLTRITQNIRLDYVLPDGAIHRVFRGALPLLHRASRILGITWSGASPEDLVDSYQVFSKTARSDLYGSLHCGTRYETLYAEVVPELDSLDMSRVPVSEDSEGKQFAVFSVVYEADPLLETVSSMLESPEYRPAGVDILVKSGPMLLVDDLEITYTKKSGANTALSAARDRIVEYMRTVGHPDVFRLPEIHDIVRNAGADRVVKVQAVGRIFVSAADRLFRNTITDPAGTQLTDDWSEDSDQMKVIPVVTLEQLTAPLVITDGEISVNGPPDAWVATSRTVRYAIEPQNVRFIETS